MNFKDLYNVERKISDARLEKISKLEEKLKQTQDDLKHALTFNRVHCKIEFWEAILAPNLLVEAEQSSTTSAEDTADSGERKDRRSEIETNEKKKLREPP